MLFLLRPRQTRLPFGLPRDRAQQEAYNRQLQQSYSSSRRTAPANPEVTTPERDTVGSLRALASLHDSGALTDAEFAKAKARVLTQDEEPG